MADNVILMPEPLDVIGKRIDAAYERAQRGHQEWIEGTLELVEAIGAARERFQKDDRAFGHWLVDNGHDHVSHQDRAALIKMADNLALARIILQETERRSYRHIWDFEMKERFTHVGKHAHPAPSESEPPGTALPEPRKAETPEQETIKAETPSLHRSPFKKLKLPDAEIELVHRHVLEKKTRGTLADIVSKKSTRPIWNLLIEVIQSGAYGPPSAAVVKVNNLRLLFPWLGGRDSFGNQELSPDMIKFVRSYVLPLLAENSSLMRPDGGELNRLSKLKRAEHENKERERLRLEQHQAVAKTLPINEKPVIAYGVPLWPPVDDIGLGYNYNELQHAAWYWLYFLGIARRDWSPKDTGMAVRHLTKYLEPLQSGFVTAIRAISIAYEQNSGTESKFPMIPVNFGLS